MKTTRSIMQRILNLFELMGRERVRKELLNMTPHQLKDVGFSRDRLERGISEWPWRIDTAEYSELRVCADNDAGQVRQTAQTLPLRKVA